MVKPGSKQKTQVRIVVILAGGLIGYIAYPMVTPKPVMVIHPTAAAAKKAAAAVQTASNAEAASEVPPPNGGIRDPFIAGIVDPATVAPVVTTTPAKPTKQNLLPLSFGAVSVPRVPSLPGKEETKGVVEGALPSLPGETLKPLAPQAEAPAWNLTGVISSGTGGIAILRNGDTRQIARQGDLIDGGFRVVSILRSAVVLSRGNTEIRIPLSAAKPPDQPTAPDAKVNGSAGPKAATPTEGH